MKMISAGEPFGDRQGLLSGGIGTLRNAGEPPFMIAYDLFCPGLHDSYETTATKQIMYQPA